jgi:hypothetical protein
LILDAVAHWGLFLKSLEAAAERVSNATITVECVAALLWYGMWEHLDGLL